MPVISQEQLDDLIDRGKRLRELTRYFQHRCEALGAYATRQHFHYDLKSAFDQPCCACLSEPCDVIVEYRWEALVLSKVRVGWLDLLALWLFRFTIPRVKFDWIGFRTYHPFCARCRRVAKFDESLAAPLSAVIAGGLMLAWIFFIFGLGMTRITWAERATYFGVSALFLLGVWLCFQAMHRVRTPYVLRQIARWPFRYRVNIPVEDVACAMLEALDPPTRHEGVEALELKRLRSTKQIPSVDPQSADKPSAP